MPAASEPRERGPRKGPPPRTLGHWPPRLRKHRSSDGHGQTSASYEQFTYWDSAIANLQVLDALGIPEAFCLGTSQGGWIAARMAILAPGTVKGKVRYRLPGGSVTTLGDAVIVPNGTVVDATKGTVKVTVERSPGGPLDSLNAWAGGFVVVQGQNGVTTLTLAAPLASKASRATRTARASRKRHGKHKWLLWADGKGNFKTKGNKASAVLRGTAWVTADTGTSTKVSVKRGAVLVRDFVTHRSVIVTAGHSYTAREKRASARRVPAFTGRA